MIEERIYNEPNSSVGTPTTTHRDATGASSAVASGQQHDINGQSVNVTAANIIEPAAHEELRRRMEEAESQANNYKDQWQRALADFKNYKRRAEVERGELIRNASADTVLKVLPIIDDFERAIENIPPEIANHSWWKGTYLISQKLRTLLESEGVTPIDAVGQEFDPNLHDAFIYEDAAGQDNKVIAVLQQGYKMHDRVLRPALVKVGKG